MDQGISGSRRGWIGVGLVAAAIVAAGPWASGLGPTQDSQPARTGQVHITSVENNHSHRVELLVLIVTEDEHTVDGNGTTLIPGAQQPFGLLDCRNGDDVAERLWILANTDGEPGYEIDEFVELEEGECGHARKAEFEISIETMRGLSISR